MVFREEVIEGDRPAGACGIMHLGANRYEAACFAPPRSTLSAFKSSDERSLRDALR